MTCNLTIESDCVPVTLRAGAEPFTIEELRTFLAGKLGKHELPVAVEFMKELPRTSVGKLSRHELRNQQRNQSQQPKLATGGRS